MDLQKEDLINEYIEMGFSYHVQNDYHNAIKYYENAFTIEQKNPRLLFYLGTALSQIKQYSEAEYFLQKSIEGNPYNIATYLNLGKVYRNTKDWNQALNIYFKALEIDPKCIEIYWNLFDIYLELRAFYKALNIIDILIDNNNQLAKAYFYKSIIFANLDECHSAIKSAQLALDLDPSYHIARSQIAFMKLKLGNYKAMWCDFEIRHAIVPHYKFPNKFGKKWSGEDFKNRSILILTEQGLGDILQFVRFIKLVKARGGRVSLCCSTKMFQILKSIEGVDEIIDENNILTKFNYSIFLMSLFKPLCLNSESIGSFTPYIKADGVYINKWVDRLDLKKFNIGIVWQGNPENGHDAFRSFKLLNFYPLSKIPNVQLISLQKYHGTDQIADIPFDMNLLNWENEIDSGADAFVDSAALIHHLDLVITIDSAIAHLAGAMGRPVWTLLGLGADWRWGLKSTETIWYPTMQLFRLKLDEEPDMFFARVTEALRELVIQSPKGGLN